MLSPSVLPRVSPHQPHQFERPNDGPCPLRSRGMPTGRLATAPERVEWRSTGATIHNWSCPSEVCRMTTGRVSETSAVSCRGGLADTNAWHTRESLPAYDRPALARHAPGGHPAGFLGSCPIRRGPPLPMVGVAGDDRARRNASCSRSRRSMPWSPCRASLSRGCLLSRAPGATGSIAMDGTKNHGPVAPVPGVGTHPRWIPNRHECDDELNDG